MNPATKHQFWADVAVFEDLNDGKTIENFLTNKGLEARTYDDKWFRYFLFLRPPRITYRVQIRHDHFQDAEDFLNAEPPLALKRAMHCPACDSLQVSYPQMTRQFVMPTVLLHLGIIFRFIEHECYCEHCHFIWNLPDGKVHLVPKPAKHFPF